MKNLFYLIAFIPTLLFAQIIQDPCTLSPDPGPCIAAVPKYYFNQETQQCTMFTWGGCAGIVPFNTLSECEAAACTNTTVDSCYSVSNYKVLLEQSNLAISYQLTTGWNMVGYTGSTENSGIVNQINTALSNDATVENTFQVIKNVSGQFWSSAFAQISNFTQGEGYMMYVITETAPELSFLNTINLPVVLGCLDCSSEFYNPWATQSDGSCGFSNQGCTDENYIEYNELATEDDGSCLTIVYLGCTYPLAINYNELANIEDGSCIYFIIEEQTGSNDCDFNFAFTNTGSNMTVFFTPPTAAALTAELGEGTLGAFFLDAADTYFCASSADMSGAPQQFSVMGDDATTPEIQDGFNANQEILWIYESNDGSIYSLSLSPSDAFISNGYSNITDYVATSVDCGGSPACPYDAYLEYSSTATDYNVSECLTLVVEGCTSDLYFEYNPEANREDGTCLTLIVEGCTDSAYAEYNAEANTDDGSCNTLIVLGCNNPLADNYNAQANTNDGICIIYGCMDMLADNYNAEANTNDDNCIYYGCINTTADNYNENANTDDDTCIIYGCTLADFPNYNSVATVDDFSCDMESSEVFGCTGVDYTEYNIDSSVDNGTCLTSIWCTDSNACNYNPDATEDGVCEYYTITQHAWSLNGVLVQPGTTGATPAYNSSLNAIFASFEYPDVTCLKAVGDLTEGGIVFYIDETGEHGLVAATEDLASTYEWGCHGTTISGADGQSIGTGLQNTLDIVSGCSQTPIAASLALAYQSEGYSDWYLPSR